MDFGGTPRAGAVLDRVSAPRAGTSPRRGVGSRASATGSSSPAPRRRRSSRRTAYRRSSRRWRTSSCAPTGASSQRKSCVGDLPRLVEDGHRAPGQWHPVLELRLHTRRRHSPGGRGVVHLVPARPAGLARAAGCEHEELEGERRGPVGTGCAHPCKSFADPRVRERLLVLAAHAVPGQRGGDGVARRVVLAVALCATAHFMTAPIRCRTRRAVSRFVDQIGSRTSMTSAAVMRSTRFAPIFGTA